MVSSLLARSSPPNQRFPGTRRDECRETTSPTTTTIELWEMEFEVSLENEQQFWDGKFVCLAGCSITRDSTYFLIIYFVLLISGNRSVISNVIVW